ncbi:Hypothetical_protein [Hexamita inflata]|uniref:Hypothetical_protein n=1 Tax=Hexamita inflata TaxID=28002 RepID=A0AA86PHT0_9EUKA|nr:Hypothetical protein HINF_LOCUS6583 [Hexamita inflata]CAI9938527.1 Hypothetical protein HINF_LOCUS26172 [Hexamita inflata]
MELECTVSYKQIQVVEVPLCNIIHFCWLVFASCAATVYFIFSSLSCGQYYSIWSEGSFTSLLVLDQILAALLCNTELVSLLRCFCWGNARWRLVAGLGVRFWWGNARWACSGLAAWRDGCGAALLGVVGRSVGGFAAWGSLGRVLPWFCSLVCLLCACLVLFRLPGFCFDAAKFSLFYFPLGKWRQTLELRVPSSNPGRKSHADPFWEHFARNNPIKQGSSASDKSYFAREFHCLGFT